MTTKRDCIVVAATIALMLTGPVETRNCTNILGNNCREGLLLPLWKPTEQLCLADRILRGLIYLLALTYMFLGVSIAADRFMGAIEVITSQERSITLRKKDGSKVKIKVRIWNETVSNLTLMALGSSAPEILLSIIEICGNGFEAGDLGPNTATAGSDYVAGKGTLVMGPDCIEAFIEIPIIDDDIFEEDEHFYIFLDNLQVKSREGNMVDPETVRNARLAVLETPSIATVMILDDDHPGLFSFENDTYDVAESTGDAIVKVIRRTGSRGRVLVPFATADGTGKAVIDYEPMEGALMFENEEVEKSLQIGIVNKEQYERNEYFVVTLSKPVKLNAPTFDEMDTHEQTATSVPINERIEEMGQPALGKINKCVIKIHESREFKNAVDMLIKKTNVSLLLRTSTWREQFVDAVTMNPSVEGEEEEEPAKPTAATYAVHILTMPWKLMCAFVPPTDYWSGWASFVFSIVIIGFITALIGDLTNHFGCTVGLIDVVTAITFVAIGTSVPDTFASHVAAIQDKYADSSITNVTGSNAVNVFLGIGLAWTIAAAYHAYNGDQFKVHAGTLAFSVTIFCLEATACIVILVARRSKSVGGELGGPLRYKVATAITFVALWFVYILLSSLESYCIISGF